MDAAVDAETVRMHIQKRNKDYYVLILSEKGGRKQLIGLWVSVTLFRHFCSRKSDNRPACHMN